MGEGKIEVIPGLITDASERQYLPGDRIGVGGFASCFRAKVLDRRLVPEAPECALKVVRAGIEAKHLRTRFKIELGVHSKLRHANIVEFHRAFTFEDLTYIQLELCVNGSLTDMVRRRKFLTMGEIRRFLIQLCGAVKYLHARDVVHRDIKSGNVFLDANMNAKLGDFGLAAVMEPAAGTLGAAAYSHARRTTFCGTPNYLAPEVLSRDGSGHGTSVDIWALGILAYYLAVGRAPFHSKSKEEIYARLKTGEYTWPELDPEENEIPSDLRSLVGTLLVEECRRPSADQMVRHAFFSKGFIPDRLDALARTRRPRWARMAPGALPDSSRAYEELCRSSQVGPFDTQVAGHVQAPCAETATTLMAAPTMSVSGRRTNATTSRNDVQQLTTVMLALEREYAAGIRLEIPLVEGVVYHARTQVEAMPAAPASRKRQHVPEPTQVYEDVEAALPAQHQHEHAVAAASHGGSGTHASRAPLGETTSQGRLPRVRRTEGGEPEAKAMRAEQRPASRAAATSRTTTMDIIPSLRSSNSRARLVETSTSRPIARVGADAVPPLRSAVSRHRLAETSAAARPASRAGLDAVAPLRATASRPHLADAAGARPISHAMAAPPSLRSTISRPRLAEALPTRPTSSSSTLTPKAAAPSLRARPDPRVLPSRTATAPSSKHSPPSRSRAAQPSAPPPPSPPSLQKLVIPRSRARTGPAPNVLGESCANRLATPALGAMSRYEIGGGVLALQGRAKRPRRAGICYD